MVLFKINLNCNGQASWLLWPVLAFILSGTLACRVEVSRGTVSAALAQAPPTPTVVRNELPLALPALPPTSSAGAEGGLATAPVTPSTPTPTVASMLLEPTPIPTPTSPPVIPAQTPPTRIIAPAIGLDAPVKIAGWTVVKQNGAETSVWDVPVDAAGWHQNSALPGQGGNIVLSGHHNIGAEVFRYLVELKKGDKIILQADGRDYRYTVTDHFILPERGVSEEQQRQNVQWIMPTTAERLTLVTCWPYDSNSHRVIVVAIPNAF